MIRTNFKLSKDIKSKHRKYFNEKVIPVMAIIINDKHKMFQHAFDSTYISFLRKVVKNKSKLLFSTFHELPKVIDDFQKKYNDAFFAKKINQTNFDITRIPFTDGNNKFVKSKFNDSKVRDWLENTFFTAYFKSNIKNSGAIIKDCLNAFDHDQANFYEYLIVLIRILREKNYKQATLFLFRYAPFRSSSGTWNGSLLFKSHDLRSCPYCGRQYVTPRIDEKEKIKASAQLDHIYPKDKYPYLSMALYNLMPSCAVCNQGKSSKDTLDKSCINPFTVDLNAVTFKLVDVDTEDEFICVNMALANKDKLKIKLEYTGCSIERDNSNEIFHLEEHYRCHLHEVEKLLDKISKSRSKYYQEMVDVFQCGDENEFLTHFFSEVHMYNERELPLNKMYCSIYNQFK